MRRDLPDLTHSDSSARTQLVTGLDEAAHTLANPVGRAETLVRALLVGKANELEQHYWRLKLLKMAYE